MVPPMNKVLLAVPEGHFMSFDGYPFILVCSFRELFVLVHCDPLGCSLLAGGKGKVMTLHAMEAHGTHS
jgi:hypothetical protein